MKTSIYRCIFIFAYVLLFVVICSCNCNKENKTSTDSEIVFNVKLDRFDKEFKIVVIDSCEYLYTDASNKSQTIVLDSFNRDLRKNI